MIEIDRVAPARRAWATALAVALLATALVVPALQVSSAAAGPLITSTADCDADGTSDLAEASWANRDDDGDSLCNGVDPCPDETDPSGDGTRCTMRAITVPADPNDPAVAHPTYSGATVTLKGIARYGGNQFTWDFGDGTAPTSWTSISNAYDLGVRHVYTGAVGQRFTATLSVRDSAAPAVVSSATYPVEVFLASATPTSDAATDVRVDMAVDDALWYLHTQQQRALFGDGAPGYRQRYGFWSAGSATSWYAQCTVADAFLTAGHRPSGSYATDPYVDTVERAVNLVLTQAAPQIIGAQSGGREPDTNGNGYGLMLNGQDNVSQAASCLTMLARTETPGAIAVVGNATRVRGRTYAALAQDAADWLAWAQNDPEHGVYRGSWYFFANVGLANADPGFQGLPALALGSAEATMGTSVPAWVRTELALWVAYARNTTASIRNGGWGLEHPNDGFVGIPNTGAALLNATFTGMPSTHPVHRAGVGFMHRIWEQTAFSGTQWNTNLGHGRTMYTVAIGLRASEPAVTRVTDWDYVSGAPTASSFDWFYSRSTPKLGYALHFVNRQAANGSWTDTNGFDSPPPQVSTALGVLTLVGTNPFARHVSVTATHVANGTDGWSTTPAVIESITTTGTVTSVSCSDGTTTFPATGGGSSWTATITGEGIHDITCTATGPGAAATSAVDTVKIDTTPPVITLIGEGTYDVDGTVSVTCTASDTVSGVASSTCAPYIADASTLTPGQHELTFTATDGAGNISTVTAQFAVVVTRAGLAELVKRFVEHHGTENSLLAKLKSESIKAFQNAVSAQSGGKIPEDSARLLIDLAGRL